MNNFSAQQHLERFRATHKPRFILAGGMRWEYRMVGSGDSCVLVLPGIHGKGELAFRLAEALQASHRVVLPSYPPARRMAQLADGLIAILNAENIQRAHVFGSSYGGMVAQCLARQYPHRVGRLILTTTTAPNNEPLRRARMLARFATFLSAEAVKAAMRRRARSERHGRLSPSCLAASMSELRSAFNAQTLVCRLLAAAEFLRQQPDNTGARTSPDSVLILLGERDPMFTLSERRNLSSQYPQAAIHVIHKAGHFLEPEVQAALALPFLAS